MKMLIALSLSIIALASSAYAADEFGERFGVQAPAALNDTPAEQQQEILLLQKMEPAAGEPATDSKPAATSEILGKTPAEQRLLIEAPAEEPAETINPANSPQ